MSDITRISARPVSLFTIVFLAILFAAGFFFVRHYYAPAPMAAYNASAENLSKDFDWRATSEARRAALKELRDAQTKKLQSLPIDRAMELTAEKYGANK
jgi:hypothetical protein